MEKNAEAWYFTACAERAEVLTFCVLRFTFGPVVAYTCEQANR